ncbi:MAG TPA: hypothetical protein PLC04_07965 [Candidatus Kapabacteria bacterium]|nr:hypothetical protein [Candidatus Kapabacteria bacterium]
MTLREISNILLENLKENSGAIGCATDNIRAGKAMEMPSEAPFVWLYAEPKDLLVESRNFIASGQITLFCGVQSELIENSRIDAIELAERVYRILASTATIEFEDIKISFDNYYNDIAPSIAVAVVEISIIYELTELI